MDDRSLDGLRVLVARPAEQAEPLCRLLERHGATVVQLPMQAIEPIRQSAAAAAQLQQQRDALAWIFTSVNAVRYARALDAGVWPPCIAIGPATASALTQAGIEDVSVPDGQHDSEAVLALERLLDVQGRRIVVVTGEGGRNALEQELTARGAQVSRVEVYRRVALPHTAEALAGAVSSVDAAVFTNGESLRLMFTRIADEARLRLLDLQLVVPSRRVVEQALELAQPLQRRAQMRARQQDVAHQSEVRGRHAAAQVKAEQRIVEAAGGVLEHGLPARHRESRRGFGVPGRRRRTKRVLRIDALLREVVVEQQHVAVRYRAAQRLRSGHGAKCQKSGRPGQSPAVAMAHSADEA